MQNELQSRVELCGELVVRIRGRDFERAVPGARGRLLLAYLVWNRRRSVPRDELIAALWPDSAPASPEGALSTLLTRLRQAVGDDVITGRRELAFVLADASVDVEQAAAAVARAAASVATAPVDATAAAREAIVVAEQPFLPGIDVPWVAARRRELEHLLTEALETLARASLTIGGDEVATAEAAARRVIELEPYRESAYALAMEAAAARGNVASALLTFEDLRVRLRDELGTSPTRALLALHERLVRSDDVAAAPPVRVPAELAHAATRVVARGRELERLRARWRTAATGRLQMVLLEGEPGIGKTALLAAIAREAAASGITFYGRADEDAVVPYQPFVEAIRQAVRAGGVPKLTTTQRRELARLVPDLEEEHSFDEDLEFRRYALFEAVAAVVRDAASVTPVLLALDDLHWADASTLLMLRHLIRGAGDARLCVAVTVRSGEAPHRVLDAVVDELERRGAAERIALAGLDTMGVAALVAGRLEDEAEPEVVAELERRTNGNPLFVEETLRGLDRPTAACLATTIHGGVPDAVKVVVSRRVAAMGNAAAVLELAAVIGREFTLRVLEAAYREPERVAAAVDDAVRRELLVEQPEVGDRLAFVHAVVREALYEQQTATRRMRAHAVVAEVLEHERAPVAEVAHHFFYGRHILGAERTVAYCVAAAEDATAHLAHEDAVQQYKRALVASDGDADRVELLLALAEALERAGDLYASRDRFREAAEAALAGGSPPGVVGRAALGFAKYQEYGVVDTEAIQLLEEALGRDIDDACRARLTALLAIRLDRVREQPRREALFDDATRLARRANDRNTLGAVLVHAPFVLAQPERVYERLAAADETIAIAAVSQRAEWELSARVTRFVALLTIGDIAAADEELLAYSALAEDLRHPWSRWYARMLAATRTLLSGDVARGRALSDEAWELRRVHEPDADEVHVAQSVMAAIVAGSPEEIELERVRRVADRFAQRPGYRALYALAAAAAGDTAAAQAEIERYRADEFGVVRRGPDALNALALLGETAVLVGDEATAPVLYSALSRFADFNVVMDRGWAAWGSVSRHLSLLAALTRDEDAAERHAAVAAQRNDAFGSALSRRVFARRDQ